MDATYWRRVEQVLDLALESDPSSWPEVLDRVCSGDVALRTDAENLLSRYTAARSFLSEPPSVAAAALVAEVREPVVEVVEGRRIGAWRMVRELGRGGMSRVYLAERADGAFEQRVALKLMRADLDSEIEHERFRAERQILASLNHPNIARLLDGGVTDSGVHYLVLEYVDGKQIDVYCDEQGLDVRARVELFLSVIDGTAHAHRNLVVHRDLKPSNVFITADGTVKLLDFGLAKLLESQDPMRVARTTLPGRRWMTPEYAAPEQIMGARVTTLTDVYQLGATLYELLAGIPPLGRRDGNLHNLQHAVVKTDPQPPSAQAYELRRRALQGDLDAIVLKALRKEPEQRYASAQALADDLRKYLSGHPVAARRQTAAYRALRFARRHRALLLATLTIAVVLGAYITTVTIDRTRIRNALNEATAGTHKAEQVTDFMLGLFDESQGGQSLRDTVTARALLNRGLARARELKGQPELRAQMLDVVGRLDTRLGDLDEAKSVLEEALSIRRTLHGNVHRDVATTLQALGQVYYEMSDYTRAASLRREALDVRRTLDGPDDPKTVNALMQLAAAMHGEGDYVHAEPLLDEWAMRVSRQPPETTAARANQLRNLSAMYDVRGQYDKAEQLSRNALEIDRALYGDVHPYTANGLTDLAAVLDQQGGARRDTAEMMARQSVAIYRSLYPDGNNDLAYALGIYGVVLEHERRFAEAEAPLREALTIATHFSGKNSQRSLDASTNLSIALTATGRYDEAVALAQNAVDVLRAKYGRKNPLVIRTEITLADAIRGQGKYAEAEPMLLNAYHTFESGKGFGKAGREYSLGSLVRLYEAQGKAAEAAKYRALRRPLE